MPQCPAETPSVHDENSWSLNGVAGHAGVFSTAHDLGVFCQMILNNGSYHGTKILEPWTVDLIFHNYNTQCQCFACYDTLPVSDYQSPTTPMGSGSS